MSIAFALLIDESLYRGVVENDNEIKIGSHKKDDVFVSSMCHTQMTIKLKGKKIIVKTKAPFTVRNEAVNVNSMIRLDDSNTAFLYMSEYSGLSDLCVKLPYNCIFKLGRKPDNDIVIKLPFVSGRHCVIKNESGNVRIEDCGSTNGIYLNGKRVSIAKLKSGDVVSVWTLNIRLLNGELLFENVDGNIISNINEHDAALDTSNGSSEIKDKMVYKRSPRTQESLPSEDIILSAPPAKGQKYEKSRGLFASIAGSGAMMISGMAMGVASPAMLAARAASVVSPVASIASGVGGNKSRKKKIEEYERLRAEKYGAYIEDQKAKIENVASVQRDIITRENPSVKECAKSVINLNRNLWNRMPGDRDFLDVRVGMGYEPLCVSVKSRTDSSGFQIENDEIMKLSESIIEETRLVDNIPKRISFRNNSTIGIIGNRKTAVDFVKNLLIALTSSHCYEDVRIVGIFDESERSVWDSIKWLPHIWDENGQFRYLAYTKEDSRNLCDLFVDILKKRFESINENRYFNTAPQNPHYVFIFGSKALVEKDKIMTELFHNRPEMGITSLFLFNDMYSLPHDCRFIFDVDNGPCGYERDKVNERFYFTFDEGLTDSQFDYYTRFMSAVKLDGFASAQPLPNGITFLQGYGCETVNQLNVMEKWDNSIVYKSLAAPIGVLNGHKTFYLDIHEKAHGPHGLVAGTTGSGKSELLQTWILSMAICYHPHDVNFVIIDYKGGGMASLLEPLPHVVGKVTNISSNISRSLVSLESEMVRRQRIFDKYGVNHIDKYMKLYKSGAADEPLPHLIIVADEFAELKKAEPDFMAGLVRAARIGRSLGVHLVLATQKPGGVVDDQIQSNSRFRLCLKVQDVTDSREMIKRPDAAKITQAGRAFVRIGEDEYFDIIQSYWSGAPYFGTTLSANDVGNQVRYVTTNGQRVKTVSDEKTRFKSEIDELSAIVQYIAGTAKSNGISELPGPWLPDLPERVDLIEVLHERFENGIWPSDPVWLRATVGIYDRPKTQSQGPAEIDFIENGHLAVYGAPATGKTSFIKTLIMSLCLSYTPEDISIYAIDCGGWSLSSFAAMPHVGGIALDCEEEKILKLEQMILNEIESRKKRFYSNAVSSLEAYRNTVGKDIPAMFIFVDNIVSMFDLYPDLENTFITISREGATYGIYLIFTANSTTGVRYKVVQNIKGAVAFELNDKGDYTALVGKLEGLSLPKVIGRGFLKGNPPTEFQAAMFSEFDSEQERVEYIKRLGEEMREAWRGKTADPIPVMPDIIHISDVIRAYKSRTIIPLGISYTDIKPLSVDLGDSYSMLITGSIGSGKSAYLSLLTEMTLKRFPETKVYVFDGIKKSLSDLQNAVYRYSASDADASVSEMLEDIVNQLNIRKRAQNKARQESGGAFDEKSFIAEYDNIFVVIDDLKEFVDCVSDSNKNSMERICRLAQNLGVIVLVSGRVADIIKYNEIESLTRVIVGNQNGLSMGDSPASCRFFQNNLKYNEKDIDAGEGNGYVFVNGKCIKVKLFNQ